MKLGYFFYIYIYRMISLYVYLKYIMPIFLMVIIVLLEFKNKIIPYAFWKSLRSISQTITQCQECGFHPQKIKAQC